MSQPEQPLVLQLAPLPRQQIGPFLILGVDKDASKETIDAAWAQRLIWARKNQVRVPLEDINWAREIIQDRERRIRADTISFNVDTTDGLLGKLKQRFQGKGVAPASKPLDIEKNLADYAPPIPVPDVGEIRAQTPVPELPREIPAVRAVLEQTVRTAIDPWDVQLSD